MGHDIGRSAAEPEQIDVARLAEGVGESGREQHGALQHKPIRMRFRVRR
jgi:hypothetical protein